MSIQEINDFYKDYKVCIITNYSNYKLVDMMLDSFGDEISIPTYTVDGRNGLYGYKLFDKLFSTNIISEQFEYALYIDEDFFIKDNTNLYELVKYCIDNKVDIAGVPDGGVISHRIHNPIYINTFFTFLNIKKIKELYSSNKVLEFEKVNKNIQNINYSDLDSKYKKIVSKTIELANYNLNNKAFDSLYTKNWGKYSFDNFEPYYKIFAYLLENGCNIKYLSVDSSDIDMFCTSELYLDEESKSKNKLIGYHTWYAREYMKNYETTKRINSIYLKCRSL